MADYDFSGKRALVTGAGKGIGRATAKALAHCGAQVIALSRTQADLDSLQDEVKGIQTVCVDVSNLEVVKATVEMADPIHLLVNNAGIGCLQSFLDVTPESYDRIMDTNLKAVLFLSQYVAKGMVQRKEGAIVNISSQASIRPLWDHTVYSTSKAGVDMLSKVMALELGQHKVRVNVVNPGVVMTDMGKLGWSDPNKAGPMLSRMPLGKFVEVEDVVNAILFLLSDRSAMCTGVILPTDGGFTAT